jgi:hypothetical protein
MTEPEKTLSDEDIRTVLLTEEGAPRVAQDDVDDTDTGTGDSDADDDATDEGGDDTDATDEDTDAADAS